MHKKLIKVVSVLSAIILLCGTASLAILDQHELKFGKRIDTHFDYQGTTLGASLLMPEGEGPFPVVIFIHGDGPADRFAHDGYVSIMNTFLAQGIACLSWDKAGVGQSSGNWLGQTMQDRADEAVQALQLLKQNPSIIQDKIGAIGFSQGGWVLSQLAADNADLNFMIAVGVAVNWQRQSEYLQRRRMQQSGFDNAQIEIVREYGRRMDQQVFIPQRPYSDYLAYLENHPPPEGALAGPMSEARYQFVTQNIQVDMEAGLQQLRIPFLGIFGEQDANVDVKESINILRRTFSDSGHPDYRLELIPNATHSLLRADTYNFQTSAEWSKIAQLSYLLEGSSAFAEGFLDLLADWARAITAM